MSGAAADWLERARSAADRPPLRPRDPLVLDVDGRPVQVGSIEPAIAARLAAAHLPLQRVRGVFAAELDGARADGHRGRDDAFRQGWRIDTPHGPSLAAIAGWLRDAGLAGRWRDEDLAVVDVDGRALATVERGVVRVLGLTTHAVHLVGYATDGARVWVQQRARDKATDPGRWDTLMGGQVAAGETAESALARETWEEAGLDVASLLELARGERLTIRRPVTEGYVIEHIDVYTARLPEGDAPRNQDGEVERFECLSAAALAARLAADDFTLEASLILGTLLRRG